MKIFGIGASKTGTTSLTEALKILGFRASHWDDHIQLLNAHQNNDFSSKIFQDYDAFLDLPIPLMYKQLDKEFPNSKFILTIREEYAWVNSLLFHTAKIKNKGGVIAKEQELFYGNFTKDNLLNTYRQHNCEVIEYFKSKPNQLLVLHLPLKDWKPLCNFLNLQIHKQNFPHCNQRYNNPVAQFIYAIFKRLKRNK